ncbi:tRNA preQ1(34) S-adenosylmethionine ribosyltransferase-isomerase QueA [bacterium]|nr:tRNA preQ1(34) S-adenosylmethionine ribosyltransferase-isomerase QueA [bacterium]
MDLSLFDFELPEERIAQEPAKERDLSRLLVVPRTGPLDGIERALGHRTFRELPSLLRRGDLLVLNETAVWNARFLGRRERTGGRVEVLLLEESAKGVFLALVRSKSVPAAGERIELEDGSSLTFQEALGGGRARVALPPGTGALELAERAGRVPLPPYVRREGAPTSEDRARYQTVYARSPGAVAAPTAGLHFTPALLERVAEAGVATAKLVLHVGLGTFEPLRARRIEEHSMHAERYEIPDETLAALESARREGRRVIACGTTTVRALESLARSGKPRGLTDIFIHPPHPVASADALITNFHLPRSTLLLLVSAFAGRERILAAYREAIARGYRFYSYGDAMLIE